MADAPEQWQEFVELCRDGGTIRSAAAALLLVESRFETPVPTAVFKQLSIDRKRRRRALLFWETDQFCWNSNGLPMLLLSALTGENRKRKVDMLTRSWLPGLKFLSGYYNQGKALSTLTVCAACSCTGSL